MTNFKIDTTKIIEKFDTLDLKLCSYCESIDQIYNLIKNTDSSWNDKNSFTFISNTKEDKLIIDEYLDNLKLYSKEIKNFINNISNIFSQYGYKKLNITYSDEFLKEIINELNLSVTSLNYAEEYLDYTIFTSDLSYFYEIKELKETINNIKNQSLNIISDINNVNKKILLEIEETKNKISKININDLNLNKMKYNWSTTENSLTVNKFDTDIEYKNHKLNNNVSNIEQNYNYDVSANINKNTNNNAKIEKNINNKLTEEIIDVSQNEKKENEINFIKENIDIDKENKYSDLKENKINNLTNSFENKGFKTNIYDVEEHKISNNINS